MGAKHSYARRKKAFKDSPASRHRPGETGRAARAQHAALNSQQRTRLPGSRAAFKDHDYFNFFKKLGFF
jgi:hypothetical protein